MRKGFSPETAAQLDRVAQSYDYGIDLGWEGDPYKNLPPYITEDPDYPLYAQAQTGGDSGLAAVRDYLAPQAGMRFIDLGCCLNLMLRGYDAWPSLYHGIDISPKTIALLESHTAKNSLTVGSLICGSIHEAPFADDFFDIGACIGVLEYFEEDFVDCALTEAHRILKPGARFVLDIPFLGDPIGRIMMLIEAHLGRPDTFPLTREEFEALLPGRFAIDRAEAGAGMLRYFLRCEK